MSKKARRDLTFTCVECHSRFERVSKFSLKLTCSDECSRVRHRRNVNERDHGPRVIDREMKEARALRAQLAPLDALVRRRQTPVNHSRFWR